MCEGEREFERQRDRECESDRERERESGEVRGRRRDLGLFALIDLGEREVMRFGQNAEPPLSVFFFFFFF